MNLILTNKFKIYILRILGIIYFCDIKNFIFLPIRLKFQMQFVKSTLKKIKYIFNHRLLLHVIITFAINNFIFHITSNSIFVQTFVSYQTIKTSC